MKLCSMGVVTPLFLTVAGCVAQPAVDHLFFLGDGDVVVIAHRGGAGVWPENTLRAFEGAFAAGADILELDVHASLDGAIVVIHDDTVDRTTQGVGAVSTMTLEELQDLDAGYRWTDDGGRTFPFRGQGMTIPRLAEVFEALPDARFSVEIKPEDTFFPEILCDELLAFRMADRVLVSSFQEDAMDAFREACPPIATSATTGETAALAFWASAGVEAFFPAPAEAVHVPYLQGGISLLSPQLLRLTRQLNMALYIWTVDDEGAMRTLIAEGVDGIVTNFPARLVAILAE